MKLIYLILICAICSCQSKQEKPIQSPNEQIKKHQIINKNGNTIEKRFLTPEGAIRIKAEEKDFSTYLRNLKLKPINELVHYYNGGTKPRSNVYLSVVDHDIGNKDLHQCADAIIRLHAEHLWKQKMYEKIYYNFTNGFKVEYTKWMEGNRMQIQGNKTQWRKKQDVSNSYQDFWNYMELIFTYAGTASLSKEMAAVDFSAMKIGDILIQGGHPGHAVLVVDMAIDSNTGKKYYMLGQSYMPAQDFQILKNNNNKAISPWYELDIPESITTPEWTFNKTNLKRLER